MGVLLKLFIVGALVGTALAATSTTGTPVYEENREPVQFPGTEQVLDQQYVYSSCINGFGTQPQFVYVQYACENRTQTIGQNSSTQT